MAIQTQLTALPAASSALSANGLVTLAQGGSAAGKTDGSSFEKALSLLTSGSGGEEHSTDGISLDALMQGLNPALLAILLPILQQQAGTPGPNADELIKAAASQPDQLASFLGKPGAQTWLKQANELLAGMTAAQPTVTVPQAFSAAIPAGQTQQTIQAVTPAQAKQTLERFAAALQKDPLSPLVQQLAEQFSELAAPRETGLTASGLIATDSGSRNTAMKQTGHAGKVSVNAVNFFTAPVGTTDGKAQFQVSTASNATTVPQALTRMDALTLRSILAAPQLAGNSDDTAEDSSVPSLSDGLTTAGSPISLQDLLRSSVQPASTKEPVPMNAQTFAQDMTQWITKDFQLKSGSGFSEARLSLAPEQLGQVDVRITMHNGQLVAHFAAQTALGKEALESQMQQLRVNLQNQGLQVDRLEVTQNASLSSGMFQDQRQQNSSQHFARQSRASVPSGIASDEDFAAELTQLRGLRSAAYGATMDVTA